MDYATIIFKDTSKIKRLLERYKIVVMGNYLYASKLKSVNVDNLKHIGSEAIRLYFVFDDISMPRTGNNLRRVNVDLDEVNVTYPCSQFSTWLKIRAEVKYPFECYIYWPGNLSVDGSCPEVGMDQYNDLVLRTIGCKYLSYIPLSSTNASETKALLELTNVQPKIMQSTTDKMIVYVQGDIYGPMYALLYI